MINSKFDAVIDAVILALITTAAVGFVVGYFKFIILA